MKTSRIVLGIVMVVLGLALIAGILAATGFDFSRLGNTQPVTNEYQIKEPFKNISIDVQTADVTFVRSEEKAARIVCQEDEKIQHTAVVDGDTLKITVQNRKSWFDYLGINTEDIKLTLFLPEADYETINVKTDTGKVAIPQDFSSGQLRIETDTGSVDCRAAAAGALEIRTDTGKILVGGVTAGALRLGTDTGHISAEQVGVNGPLEIEGDTGRIELADVTCTELKIDNDTGRVTLKKVIADGGMDIKTSTGSVLFEDSDAAHINVKTSTGDVTGTLLTGKDFDTDTSTGKVSVPRTTGGECRIRTSTGDIDIAVQTAD